MKYPFQPKSTRYMLPGQFWGIPLESGKFASGRVIQVHPEHSRSFLGALMDWLGDNPPTENDLAGAGFIEAGTMHIRSIVETGWNGAILGHRPLELDSLEVPLFRSATVAPYLLRGYEIIREVAPQERVEVRKYPVLETWGYQVIKLLAEKHFGGR